MTTTADLEFVAALQKMRGEANNLLANIDTLINYPDDKRAWSQLDWRLYQLNKLWEETE